MERKIGEIFEYNGKWYQFVEVDGVCCNNCVFNIGLKCKYSDTPMQCAKFFRLDGKNGHVVLLDAIGGEYKQGNAIFRDYRCQTKPVTTDRRVYINNSDSNISLIISIKIHDLVEKFEQNKEDMETTISKDAIEHSNIENIGKNLKPFDLEAAKSGKPVCTRDGRKARIICFDMNANSPIVALVDYNGQEVVVCCHNDGRNYHAETTYNDLMILPEKKEGWVNIYKDPVGKVVSTQIVFSSEETAKQNINSNRNYISTVKIEWYE